MSNANTNPFRVNSVADSEYLLCLILATQQDKLSDVVIKDTKNKFLNKMSSSDQISRASAMLSNLQNTIDLRVDALSSVDYNFVDRSLFALPVDRAEFNRCLNFIQSEDCVYAQNLSAIYGDLFSSVKSMMKLM